MYFKTDNFQVYQVQRRYRFCAGRAKRQTPANVPPLFMGNEAVEHCVYNSVCAVCRFCGSAPLSHHVQAVGISRDRGCNGRTTENRQEFNSRKLASVHQSFDGSYAQSLQATTLRLWITRYSFPEAVFRA